MCPDGLALGNYSLEPYRKLVAGVIDDVAVFLMIVIDLCSLRHSQPCFGSWFLGRKGRLLRVLSGLRFFDGPDLLSSTPGITVVVGFPFTASPENPCASEAHSLV